MKYAVAGNVIVAGIMAFAVLETAIAAMLSVVLVVAGVAAWALGRAREH